RAKRDGPPNHRRYAQDVACELHYHDLCKHFQGLAQRTLSRSKMNDLARPSQQERETAANSFTAWRLLRLLERIDVAYGQGDVDAVIDLMEELTSAGKPLDAPTTSPAMGDGGRNPGYDRTPSRQPSERAT
ncbi:MAG TPA: hypothetical protein VLM89_08480, partial [Phycisphaerae bacterium]|nr:hypothetical protein [Phycisphaerae bacterium]